MNIAAEREIPLQPLLGEPEDERDTLDLVRYWRAVNRNKWRILALVAAVGILAQLYASGLPPVYRATATILSMEFQLAALEREVATSRQFYDMFMQRYKETNLSGEMHSPIARVVDPAILPSGPFGPNKRLIVGLSLLAALLAGEIGRASCRERV